MYEFIKRATDIFISITGLIVFAPFFITIASFIKIDRKGPVFFRQERVGRDFKSFRIYKFRTMAEDFLPGAPITVCGDRRITLIGRILRKSKIDELPQLVNVFKGEMSVVGPRPEVPKYVEMFREEYEKILKVRPGITDYAAIEFSDEETILARYNDPEKGYIEEVLPRKIVLYNRYLKEKGFLVDIKIIWLTIYNLLTKK